MPDPPAGTAPRAGGPRSPRTTQTETRSHAQSTTGPGRPAGAASRASSKRSARLTALAVAVLLVTGLAAYADRAFLTSAGDRPVAADAIVVLGGEAPDSGVPDALVHGGYAGTIVYSHPYPQPCPPPVPGRLRTICFHPDPESTQGEARAVATLARTNGWHRLLVVSGHAQMRRARLRIQRCWNGQVLMVPAPVPARIATRLRDVAYETFATLKAQLWQRSC